MRIMQYVYSAFTVDKYIDIIDIFIDIDISINIYIDIIDIFIDISISINIYIYIYISIYPYL